MVAQFLECHDQQVDFKVESRSPDSTDNRTGRLHKQVLFGIVGQAGLAMEAFAELLGRHAALD